jgi:hypothetical protein
MSSRCKHGIDWRFCSLCGSPNPTVVSTLEKRRLLLAQLATKRHFPLSARCEVCTIDGWQEISIDEALKRRARVRLGQRHRLELRCVECKQPVVVRTAGENRAVAHVAHRKHPTLCSRRGLRSYSTNWEEEQRIQRSQALNQALKTSKATTSSHDRSPQVPVAILRQMARPAGVFGLWR